MGSPSSSSPEGVSTPSSPENSSEEATEYPAARTTEACVQVVRELGPLNQEALKNIDVEGNSPVVDAKIAELYEQNAATLMAQESMDVFAELAQLYRESAETGEFDTEESNQLQDDFGKVCFGA